MRDAVIMIDIEVSQSKNSLYMWKISECSNLQLKSRTDTWSNMYNGRGES